MMRSRPSSFGALGLLGMLSVAGCGFVKIGDPSGAGGGGAGAFVPGTVHYRDGHVVAEAFVEADENAKITMTLEGPGASATPAVRRCSPAGGGNGKRSVLHCPAISNETTQPYRPGWLESQSASLDKSALAAGPYTLKLLVNGNEVAKHSFSLAKMPTTGNATTFVSAPKDRPSTLVFDGYRATAWVPIDGRASWGDHYVRFAWITEGAVVASDDTEIAAPYLARWVGDDKVDLDAPVVDVRPVPLEAPKTLDGPYTVVALLDGEEMLATWEVTVRNGALVGDTAHAFGSGPPAVGYVRAGKAASESLVAEVKKKHHVGPPTRPLAEPSVCAYAFDPAARPLLEKSAKLSGASWAMIGAASAAYQSEYHALATKAAAQGRITEDGKHVYVSQKELDDANHRGDARAKPADEEKKKIEAEAKAVGKQLGELSKKYKAGCLRDTLRESGVTFAE